jgi:hypothetical protein
LKFLIQLLFLPIVIGCGGYPEPRDVADEADKSECVILLHGLARTHRSMGELEKKLGAAGYSTINQGYPSRDAQVEELAEMAIAPAVELCRDQDAQRINFVTHSLGGILVRYYLSLEEVTELHRVVMLSPPNQGSEVVDMLREVPGFSAFYGPAFLQLGTDENSLPLALGAPDFEVGIIAGDNAGLFSGKLAGEDDGAVTVERTMLEGMADFVVVDAGHTFIMNDNEAIRQTIHFLKHGQFDQ